MGFLPSLNDVVSMPKNPICFRWGIKTEARQNSLLVPSYPGSFPWSLFLFLILIPCLLNALLMEFHAIAKQNVWHKLSQWHTPFKAPFVMFVPNTHAKRPFKGEPKRDIYCFPSQPDKFFFHSPSSLSCPRSLMLSSSQLILLARFGAIPWQWDWSVTLHQLYVPFLSPAHSVNPTSVPSYPSTILKSLVLLCKQIICLQPSYHYYPSL